jgi:hypothetical protein
MTRTALPAVLRRVLLAGVAAGGFALAGCTPASIGITGPGAQANRPVLPTPDDNAVLTSPGPTVGGASGFTATPGNNYGTDGRYFSGY